MTDPAQLVLFTVCSLLLHIVAERRRRWFLRALTKTAASSGFIAIALTLGATQSPWGQALLVALGLSMLGDLFLLSKTTAMFACGLVSFLLAHIAFGAAFIVLGVDPVIALAASVAFVLIALRVARWVLPHVPGRLRPAVIAYIIAVSGMAVLALAAGWATGNPVLPIAGAAFFVSDLLIARSRFVAPGFINRLLGLPLYYGAQILFALQAAAPTGMFAV